MPRVNDFLFLAPTFPNPYESGLSQRAYHLCRALSEQGRVHLLYLQPRIFRRSVGSTKHLSWLASITALPVRPLLDPIFLLNRLLHLVPGWRRAQRIPEWRFFSPLTVAKLRRRFADVPLKAVFAHRLYTLPYAAIAPGVPVILDLDDWESVTRSRLAGLAERNGMDNLKSELEHESARYERYERACLPGIARILVCSEANLDEIVGYYGDLPLQTLPNIVETFQDKTIGANDQRRELLFVGSFGYLPNWDAAVYAARRLLPGLPQCRLTLIGREKEKLPPDVLHHPRIDVLDKVVDLKPYYRSASLALVPIRAGGGTRIKILEAMAHGCPVVSTVEGAEGLVVRHQRELLIGANESELVECCRSLLDNPDLADRLSRNARAWVAQNHTFECWRPIFRDLVRSVG